MALSVSLGECDVLLPLKKGREWGLIQPQKVREYKERRQRSLHDIEDRADERECFALM